MKRPFILFLFMLTLCIAIPSAGTAAVTFSDTQGHWAENYIYQTAGVGLIHGYPDGTFRPDQTITRAEFITILAQESGETITDPAGTAEFSDVKADHWARKYILWGRKNNVLSGYEDNSFRPDQKISRQEMALVLYRYITEYHRLTIQNIQQETVFTDENLIGAWAIDAVKAMQRSSVINGRGDGTFDPLSGATRAETTVMLGRYLTYYKSDSYGDFSAADIFFNGRLTAQNIPLTEKNGKTMISLRSFLEGAGFRVSYFALPELIAADTENRDIELWIGKTEYYANGVKYSFSVAPYKENGTTFVALKEMLTAAGLAANLREEGGKMVIDISGSTNPLLRGFNNFYGSAENAAAVNGKIYLGGSNYGFHGSVAAGQMTYGSYTTAAGDLFFGQWSNGMMNGAGRSITSYGEFFVGTFTDGIKTTGTTYFTDGSFFRGTWSKTGTGSVYPIKGQYTAADGTTYGNDSTEWSYGSLSQSNW